MTGLEEALSAKTELGSALADGVKALSLNQKITFTLYARVILPIDGYAFWVRADLLSDAALIEAMTVSTQTLAAASSKPKTLKVAGSLHYATDIRQEESENYAANRVVFTSLSPVDQFNEIAPNLMYLAEFRGLRFSFSSRGSFYQQADLYHYLGYAVYADMASQIIDSVSDWNTTQIVSNSLPAWLALNSYDPVYGFGNPGITFYPSFLTDLNLVPPFAAVHIDPAGTRALASAPTIDPATSTHTQLCMDRVRITLWGTRNLSSANVLDMIYQYSSDVSAFGIMNIPVLRDEKRTQAELLTIAQKKTVEFEVSYLQHAMRAIAQKQIETVTPSFVIGDGA